MKNVLIPGIIAGIVILVVSTITSYFTQMLFSYNVLTLDGIRAVNDPIMMLFFLYPFVLGLAIAYLYDFAKTSFKGNALQKGVSLGFIAWIVSAIPSAFVVFTSMTYPMGFTVDMVIGSLISMLVAGLVIAKLSK